MTDPKWRAVKMRFEETEHGPEYRAKEETEYEKFYEYGEYYTEVQRDGNAVLHVLTDYYTDAVLQAAEAEDIQPTSAGNRPYEMVGILSDKLHVAYLPYNFPGSNVATLIIRHTFKRIAAGDDHKPSLTRSALPPVIKPKIANKGVENAKRDGHI